MTVLIDWAEFNASTNKV